MSEQTKLTQTMNKDKLMLFFLFLIAMIAVGFVLKLAKPVVLPLVLPAF